MESIIKELWHGNIIPQEDSRNLAQEEGYRSRLRTRSELTLQSPGLYSLPTRSNLSCEIL